MALNSEQMAVMTQVISETLRQIHAAGATPAGPFFAAGGAELKDIVKEIFAQMRGEVGSGGVRGAGRTILDERNFRRLDKFTSKEADWEPWQANVEVAVAAVHGVIRRKLKRNPG